MAIYDDSGAALVPCDGCGEEAATVHTDHASFCDSCFQTEARDALSALFGLEPRCARFLYLENGGHAVCLEAYGAEHDHG